MNLIAQREHDHLQAMHFDMLTNRGMLKVLLRDYLHKLERDDYDPDAVDKMKEVNRLLDMLERWEAQ